MKLEVEVKNSKAEFILELLNNFSYVKTKRVLTEKEKIMKELNQAIDNVILVEKGKLKARDAKELLDEL
ncbi:MAG: hypothetical protein ABI723_09110 [Bacteroidia bacterium]